MRRNRAWPSDKCQQAAVLETVRRRSDEACSGQSHLPQTLVVELSAVGGRPEPHHVLRKRSRVRRCSTTPNRSATSSESSAPERCWAERTYSLISAVTLSGPRSEEHTSELQSLAYLVCRLLLEKKKKK